MKDYIAVATITWFDEEETYTDHIILSEVSNYVDAMSRIEAHYGNSLESADIALLEGPFISMSGRYLDMFITGQLEDGEE